MNNRPLLWITDRCYQYVARHAIPIQPDSSFSGSNTKDEHTYSFLSICAISPSPLLHVGPASPYRVYAAIMVLLCVISYITPEGPV